MCVDGYRVVKKYNFLRLRTQETLNAGHGGSTIPSHRTFNVSQYQHPRSTYWFEQRYHRTIENHGPLFEIHRNGAPAHSYSTKHFHGTHHTFDSSVRPAKQASFWSQKTGYITLFPDLCCILGIANLYTTTFYPQTNGQTGRFNCSLLAAFFHYVVGHLQASDECLDAFTFGVWYPAVY